MDWTASTRNKAISMQNDDTAEISFPKICA